MKNQIPFTPLVATFILALASCDAPTAPPVHEPSRPDTLPLGMIGTDPHLITIINMIPEALCPEAKHDGEPNIAVNPMNPQIIAASAFTYSEQRDLLCSPSPCDGLPHESCRAPIYISADGGMTWALADVIASNNGITHDITLAFSPSGYLYASFLKGCHAPDHSMKGYMTMRSTSHILNGEDAARLAMQSVDERFFKNTPETAWRNIIDQPWVAATSDGTKDRVFVGANRVGESKSFIFSGRRGSGMTARVIVSPNGTPNSFAGIQIETTPNQDRNLSAIRVAPHPDGKVYAVFYRWISEGVSGGLDAVIQPFPFCEVVVVRDDVYGTRNFGQLLDAGPGSPRGKRVAGATVPLCNAMHPIPAYRLPPGSSLGNARLVGSNLSIAVDPVNEDHVVISWCALASGVYTLHTRESLNAGVTWTELFPPIPNAMNPALAVTTDGRVGLLYQQLVDRQNENWWETHFTLGAISRRGLSTREYLLHRFPDAELPILNDSTVALRPALGEYIDLEAVGTTFYGVFSGMNTPDQERFLGNIHDIYLRRVVHRELQTTTGEPVIPSVDPFFFKVEARLNVVP